MTADIALSELDIREWAAQLLEKKGWIQRKFASEYGYCLDIFDRIMTGLEEQVGADLTQWNDEPGRTKEQVLAALRGQA